jgi:CheY-like chemotaxis protein
VSVPLIPAAHDDETNRDLLSGILGAEGYNVVCVRDGDQTLRAIHNDSVDAAGAMVGSQTSSKR